MTDESVDIELRDRLIRAEQDIKNNNENFKAFKSEDYVALKNEVLSMRRDFNEKLDAIAGQVASLNSTIAKWMGGIMGLVIVVEAGLRIFFKL